MTCSLYAGVVWWIQSVYVPPEHRQKGHFKQLYSAVRDEAQKAGAAGLRLYADDHNIKAHAAVRDQLPLGLVHTLSLRARVKFERQLH